MVVLVMVLFTFFLVVLLRLVFSGILLLLLDIHGSLQLLCSSHVRERDRALLRAVMVGGVWNGFLLGHVRGQPVPCRFCGAPDHDGHLFWECTFPPPVEIRENPELHDLM